MSGGVLRKAALLLVLSLAACDNGDSRTARSEPIRLTKSGGCGDAFFWAESESGEIAVTITVDAFSRSAEAPTTISIVLPDPAIDVEILTGHSLSTNFCTDVLEASAFPDTTMTAVAGTGEITLDAAKPIAEACGSTNGILKLNGLIAGDGTTFAPIDITSPMIGCYAG